MKRMDDGKVSLVEFLSSIKFSRRANAAEETSEMERFATFDQQVRPARLRSREDRLLVRSAN